MAVDPRVDDRVVRGLSIITTEPRNLRLNDDGTMAVSVAPSPTAADKETVYETQTQRNLIHNYDFESGIGQWSNQVGTETVSSDSTLSKFGTKSLKVVTPGGANGEGARYNGLFSFLIGDTFDVTIWAAGASGNNIRLVLFDNVAASVVSQAFTFQSTGVFEKFYASLTTISTAVNSGFLIVDTGLVPQAVTWNIDSVSVVPARQIVADNYNTQQNKHQTLVASTDTSLNFSPALRAYKVLNWDTSNPVLFSQTAITTNTDATAARVGIAPASNVPNTSGTIPLTTSVLHLRSAGTSVVTVIGLS